jgi:hypothetical protein
MSFENIPPSEHFPLIPGCSSPPRRALPENVYFLRHHTMGPFFRLKFDRLRRLSSHHRRVQRIHRSEYENIVVQSIKTSRRVITDVAVAAAKRREKLASLSEEQVSSWFSLGSRTKLKGLSKLASTRFSPALHVC